MDTRSLDTNSGISCSMYSLLHVSLRRGNARAFHSTRLADLCKTRHDLGHTQHQRRFTSKVHLPPRQRSELLIYSGTLFVLGGAFYTTYKFSEPFRHTCLAVVRCSRIAESVVLGAIDYKLTFAKGYDSEEKRQQAYSECHTRSAHRVLKALLANGGIFIKLGQHMSSLIVLPIEWTRTMRPLQDRCVPTPYEDLDKLFVADVGKSIDELFDDFDTTPLGVASLAQVHSAILKESGQQVAVKIQHPHLVEFCDIDMKTVNVSLRWIKRWFPDFEFTWLGEEMRENLPKEMDFVHEAANAARTVKDFRNVRTSLYVPEVVSASKRILIMEFIKGGRIDDLEYLADHNIDRNIVALEVQRIFCRMVHLNGWFHADPHLGNLLVRPAPPKSKSPYNFEVVLLDHGLYFDIERELRINYSKFWLALVSQGSPQANIERRKYAELVGNIGPDLYPVFETAITGGPTSYGITTGSVDNLLNSLGRAGLEGAWDSEANPDGKRASSMFDLTTQTEEEMEIIRTAVIRKEGLLLSVFDLLRRVPRRLLMLLKLNDLVRSLDRSLATTHSSKRIFLITAQYCNLAVYEDNKLRLREQIHLSGLSINGLWTYIKQWWSFQKTYQPIRALEFAMDTTAFWIKSRAWICGLYTEGFRGAHLAASGLTYHT